jgi:hypothetical protein
MLCYEQEVQPTNEIRMTQGRFCPFMLLWIWLGSNLIIIIAMIIV